MDTSKKTFLLDQLIRSFECKNTIYTMSLDKELFSSIPIATQKLFMKVYLEMESKLLINTSLNIDYGSCNIEKVYYHHKFGWVVTNKSNHAYLGKLDRLDAEIDIGINSYISGKGNIRGNGRLSIGKYTSIANNVTFLTSNISHPTQFASTYNLGGNQRITSEEIFSNRSFYENVEFKQNCIIGNDVWIGEDATIMNGVRLGDGCVIGMKALVTKDCEPYGIYGGVPAKLIRYRFPKNIIDELLSIKWWNWNKNKIKKNEDFFLTDFSKYIGSITELVEE